MKFFLKIFSLIGILMLLFGAYLAIKGADLYIILNGIFLIETGIWLACSTSVKDIIECGVTCVGGLAILKLLHTHFPEAMGELLNKILLEAKIYLIIFLAFIIVLGIALIVRKIRKR